MLSSTHLAFSDGLFQENLPPATVGDREASLSTSVSPPILTADSHDKRFIELRLYDANTGNNISNVNYFITVTKGGKMLMRDLFYSKAGPLKIQITPHEGPVNVYGSQEPYLGGWMSESGQIAVQGPVLMEGGLYHFEIEIFGIDRPNNIFNPESAPKFDSYLSVGETFKENLKYNNIVYNSTLVSYYDKIHDFKFNPDKLEASWNMPFDWNLSRIKQVNIFVHEEFKVPKNFSQFGNITSYNGTVNGIDVSKQVMIDNSNPRENIIHFMLPKDKLVSLAGQVNKNASLAEGLMKFSLKPSTESGVQATNMTSMEGMS